MRGAEIIGHKLWSITETSVMSENNGITVSQPQQTDALRMFADSARLQPVISWIKVSLHVKWNNFPHPYATVSFKRNIRRMQPRA